MGNEAILVVDDSPDNLVLTQFLLESEGFETRTAEDAEQALEVLRTYRPQLILMDVQLPGMDGLMLTRRLRADPQWNDAVIVALTAYALKGDEQNALAAGCDGYITKPISTRTFAASVRDHMQGASCRTPVTLDSGRVRWPRMNRLTMCRETADKPTRSMVCMEGSIPKIVILVVDDDKDYRILVRYQLEAVGYQVLESADGDGAFAILSEQFVPLVILDIVMPNLEGIEIITRLRRQGCHSKILAVSGAGKADEYLKLAVCLGADEKFDKSRPMSDLLGAVRALVAA